MSKTERTKRTPTVFEALSILVVMAALFSCGSIFGMNYVPLMVAVSGYSVFIAWRCGYSWKEMEKVINARIGRAVPVLSLFLCVGMLVGALIYCGTIPMLIYYGTKMISAKWLYVCAFLVCSAFSLLTGTSNGSVCTAGLAMISIGAAMPGINIGLLAGSIIGGSIIGDKLSPLSDTTLMAAAVTDNDVYAHVRHQALVVIPAAVITLIIYFGIGIFSSGGASASSDTSIALQSSFESLYKFSFILLLPVIFVVVGIIAKIPVVPTLIGASALGLALGICYQGFNPTDGVKVMYEGFKCKMAAAGNPGLDLKSISPEALNILERGGMTSMTKPFFCVFICFFFSATAELCGSLKVLLDMMSKFITNTLTLVLSTGFAMILMEMLCGASAPACSLAGSLFKDKYEQMGLSSLNLSREIEDWGTGSTAFIPWSSSGLLYASVLGVGNMTLLRYTFFAWFVWIISLVYAATGKCIKKYEPDEAA